MDNSALLEALRMADQRITELCKTVCHLSGNPRKVRAEDYAEEVRAAIAKATAPTVSRWRCPCCKSLNVQISFPTWYYESTAHDLEYVEVDSEAEISWWHCEDCDESDDGQPEDTLE